MSEPVNPYDAPDATEQKPEVLDALPLAGRGRRFLTFVIDYLAISGILTAIGAINQLLGVVLDRSVEGALLLGFLIGFYLFFEGIWGKTPGKFVLGTMVLTGAGKRPSFNVVMIRTLCRFIPLEQLSFLGDEGWHDMISDTKVVRTRVRNAA